MIFQVSLKFCLIGQERHYDRLIPRLQTLARSGFFAPLPRLGEQEAKTEKADYDEPSASQFQEIRSPMPAMAERDEADAKQNEDENSQKHRVIPERGGSTFR